MLWGQGDPKFLFDTGVLSPVLSFLLIRNQKRGERIAYC